MNAGSSLAFPGGRTLAAWWRQLTPFHPDALWVGYLLFHRLEASVCCHRLHKLPTLEYLVLKGLALEGTRPTGSGTPLEALAAQLRFDAALLHQAARRLGREGLLAWAPHALPVLSEAGRRALAQGEFVRAGWERRSFYFWQADWPLPQSLPAARFVALAQPEKLPWLPAPEVACDVAPLGDAIQQTPAWKERHGFPLDVHELMSPPGGDGMPSWEQVLVAYPHRLFAAVAVAKTATGAEQLLAWSVQTRNWELQAVQPALAVPLEPAGWFPPPVDEAAWRRAFTEWCQQRQLAADAEHCQLQAVGQRLLVAAPAAVLERLRGSKTSARAETWLLAGDGALRAAARVEFQEIPGARGVSTP